jgi:hypothetical protein
MGSSGPFAVELKADDFRYLITSTMIVVLSVWLLPVPVMVTVWFPSFAVLGTLMVTVEVPEPGAGMGLGLKVIEEKPLPDKVTAASKPLYTVEVMVEVPDLPLTTLILVGDGVIPNQGDDPNRVLIKPDWLGEPQPVARS